MASTEHLPASYNEPPLTAKFSTFTAAIDLRAQSTYPNCSPQNVMAYNSTAGILNLVLVDHGGHSISFPIPGSATGLYTTIPGAWKSIAAATDDTLTAVFAQWWVDGSTVLNP
jgi:hypothetical protein